MPPTITRPIAAAPIVPVACFEPGRGEETPRQARTRAFMASGEVEPLLGRTADAPQYATDQLLAQLQQQLAQPRVSPGDVVRLSGRLADAAKTDRGGQALTSVEQQQALLAVLETCKSHCENTPANQPAHRDWQQGHTNLLQARFHQTVSHCLHHAPSAAVALVDLMALAHLDAQQLAQQPEGTLPYMMLGTFLRMAKHRANAFTDELSQRPEPMAASLQPYAEVLGALAGVPDTLATLGRQCPHLPTRQELDELSNAVTPLLEELRRQHVIPAKEGSDTALAEAGPLAKNKTGLAQALFKGGLNLARQFDAYGAVAPMDDKAILSIMRRSAPQLSSRELQALLNHRVIELNEAQMAIVLNTPLPANISSDLEGGYASSFDEKLRGALANGSLQLTEEQIRRLSAQPSLTRANAGGLKALMDKPTAQLSEADRRLLGAVVDGNAAGKIKAWRAHNKELPGVLARSGLPEAARKELSDLYQSIDRELQTLEKGAATGRSLVSRLTASPAMLLTLAPLPLAVAFVSGDKPYSASLIAHFTKNAVFMAGLMMNELTNNRTNIDHMLNRYFVTFLANVLVAQPTFAHNEHLLESVGFGMATAVVSGGATLGVFNRDAIWSAIKVAKEKLSKAGTGAPAIDEVDRRAVADHFSRGEQMAREVKLAVEVFKKDHAVTDILNSSLTFLGSKSSEIKQVHDKAEARRIGVEPPSVPRKEDPDFYPKMGLVVLTGGISAALVVLMESMVGKADYAADGMWCTSEMLKLALNPDADMQKAVQTFKEIVGLNLVLTAFLGINKAWNFLDKGATGYASGTGVLTGANLTLPGMVGEAAGSAAGKGLSYLAETGKAAHQAAQSAITQAGAYASGLSGIARTARQPGRQNASDTVPSLYFQFHELSQRAGRAQAERAAEGEPGQPAEAP